MEQRINELEELIQTFAKNYIEENKEIIETNHNLIEEIRDIREYIQRIDEEFRTFKSSITSQIHKLNLQLQNQQMITQTSNLTSTASFNQFSSPISAHSMQQYYAPPPPPPSTQTSYFQQSQQQKQIQQSPSYYRNNPPPAFVNQGKLPLTNQVMREEIKVSDDYYNEQDEDYYENEYLNGESEETQDLDDKKLQFSYGSSYLTQNKQQQNHLVPDITQPVKPFGELTKEQIAKTKPTGVQQITKPLPNNTTINWNIQTQQKAQQENSLQNLLKEKIESKVQKKVENKATPQPVNQIIQTDSKKKEQVVTTPPTNIFSNILVDMKKKDETENQINGSTKKDVLTPAKLFPITNNETPKQQNNIKSPEIKDAKTNTLIFDTKGTLSFGDLAKQASTTATPTSSFTNTSTNIFQQQQQPKLLFGSQIAKKTEEQEHEEESVEHPETYEPIVDFKPLVQLKEVEVVTGEEDEDILFKERCKLYRFATETKEWKEKGVGEIKILKHKTQGTFRLLMRRDQVFKICLNHRIVSNINFEKANDKSIRWIANDFSEGVVNLETFLVKFRNEDLTEKFLNEVNTIKKLDIKPVSNVVKKEPDSTSNGKPLSELFKNKNQWTCNGCLVKNDESKTVCACCGVSKEGVTNSCQNSVSGFSNLINQNNEKNNTSKPFSFGLQPTKTDIDGKSSNNTSFSFGSTFTLPKNDVQINKEITSTQSASDNTQKNVLAKNGTSNGNVTQSTQGVFSFKPTENVFGTQNKLDSVVSGNHEVKSTFAFGSSENTKPLFGNSVFGFQSTTTVTDVSKNNNVPFKFAPNELSSNKEPPVQANKNNFSFFSTVLPPNSNDNKSTQVTTPSVSQNLANTGILNQSQIQAVNMKDTNSTIFNFGSNTNANNSGNQQTPTTFKFTPLSPPASNENNSIIGGKPFVQVQPESSARTSGFFNAKSDVTPNAEKVSDNKTAAQSLFSGFFAPTNIKAVEQNTIKFTPNNTNVNSSATFSTPVTSTSIFGFQSQMSDSSARTSGLFGNIINTTSSISEKKLDDKTPNTFQFSGFLNGIAAKAGETTQPKSTDGETKPTAPLFPFGSLPTSNTVTNSTRTATSNVKTIDTKSALTFGDSTQQVVTTPPTNIFSNILVDMKKKDETENQINGSTKKDVLTPAKLFPITNNETPKQQNNIKSPEIKDTKTNTLIFDTKGTLSFGDLAKQASTTATPTSSFTNTSTNIFQQQQQPKLLFGSQIAKKTEEQEHEEESVEHPETYEPIVDFKPLVQLKEVEVVTGEEDEDILFKERCKLYRFATETKEWKEKGVGEIKILKHKTQGTFRLLMRRDQVFKICLNHRIVSNINFEKANDKSIRWIANDFSEGVVNLETFLVKFRNEDLTEKFLNEVNTIKKLDIKPVSNVVKKEPDSTSNGKPLSELFKNKNQWTCNGCLVKNDESKTVCACCGVSKEGVTNSCQNSVSGFSNLINQNNEKNNTSKPFSFGLQPTKTDIDGKSSNNTSFSFGSTFTLPKNDVQINKEITSTQVPQPASDNTQRSVLSPAKFSFGNLSNISKQDNSQETSQTESSKTELEKSQNVEPSKLSNPLFSFGSTPLSTTSSATSTATTTNTSFFDSKNGFSFEDLAKQAQSTNPTNIFTSNNTNVFQLPKVLFGSHNEKTTIAIQEQEHEENGNENPESYEPIVDFKPLVQLKEVEVVTGEEDEDILFKERCKLYRFATETKEWKEKGVGEIKILKHKTNDMYRFVMRRDQVFKLCLNHRITPDIKFEKQNEKSIMWIATDFSEGTGDVETLLARFRNEDIADQFLFFVNKALGVDSTVKSEETAKKEDIDTSKTETANIEEDKKTDNLATNSSSALVNSILNKITAETETAEKFVSGVSTDISKTDDNKKIDNSNVAISSNSALMNSILKPEETESEKQFVFGSGASTSSLFSSILTFGVQSSKAEQTIAEQANNIVPSIETNKTTNTPTTRTTTEYSTNDTLLPTNDAVVPTPTTNISLENNNIPEEIKKPNLIEEDCQYLQTIVPTDELIAKARNLKLPDTFFLYERKPDCSGCRGCEKRLKNY